MKIDFEKKVLSNGLTVIVCPDKNTSVAACNLLYKVGSKDEVESRTGFAHLFEHLMFGGSKHAPSFDNPLQKAGGQNNAFTSTDITNYYITLPVENLETALWLESDRLKYLNMSQHALDVQKKVVVEEFNQRYINQPFGMEWHHLRELVYKQHPYKWPTIGLSTDHITDADLDEVQAFHAKHYIPANGILVLGGNLEYKQGFDLAEKWFGDIEGRSEAAKKYPIELEQIERREKLVKHKVPVKSISIAFRTAGRNTADFYLADLLTDILASGNSSRLYQEQMVEGNIFEDINAFVTGEVEYNLLVIKGKLKSATSFQEAENAIWKTLEKLITEGLENREFEKIQNKMEAYQSFSYLNILRKSMGLAYFEMLENAANINNEIDRYRSISKEELIAFAKTVFQPQKSNVLMFEPELA